MLSMSDLVSEIEIIKNEKPRFNFDFDDWSQELNDIHYQYSCQKIVCQNFADWVNRDRYVTFPKKEQKWKKIFRTHSNIYHIEIQLEVSHVLQTLSQQKPIPRCYRDLYLGVQRYIDSISHLPHKEYFKKLREYCTHDDYMLPDEIYTALLDRGYLYRNSLGQVVINEKMFHNNRRFKQLKDDDSSKKKKRKVYDLDEDDETSVKCCQQKISG